MLLALAVGALAAGCSGNYDLPPVDSGVVDLHEGVPDRVHTANLSAEQVNALADWFSHHRTGWTLSLADTPPGIMVYLKREGTGVAYANILGSYIYSADRRRLLTTQEREDLETILVRGSLALQLDTPPS
ncbi:MAG TPA: hypothetical protein VFE31_10330 [Opitutaceae bacterium]|nr:hypothetical protein [Opitutaceae bacterium]